MNSTTSLSQSTLIQRAENIISRQIADETLLIPITQVGADVQKIYSLNPTAVHIWENLETPITVENLTQKISQEYTADFSMIERDIISLLSQLMDMNFVEEVRSS